MSIGIGNAKSIFLGEHFVVYGCKAIGFGLDKKIEVEISKSEELIYEFSVDKKVRSAIELLQRLLRVGNFRIKVKQSEIPVSSGLGSSAALLVAVIRAISVEFRLNLSSSKICDLAYEAEKIFHGSPSGIDNTLAVYGGFISFQKRAGRNSIKPLRLAKPIHLVFIDTGKRSGTKTMVSKVRIWKERNEKTFSKLLKQESAIIVQAVKCLETGKYKRLGELMNLNQNLLNIIGASDAENEEVISAARTAGALGAKLVGAGGGGFCIALVKNKIEADNLIKSLNTKYKCFYCLVNNSLIGGQKQNLY